MVLLTTPGDERMTSALFKLIRQKKFSKLHINSKSCHRGQTGFSYMGILVLMVIAGISMTSTSLVWHIQLQKLKEQQLFYAGNAIRNAIASYYLENPSGAKEYPQSLEELLLDKRHPIVKRHLRRNYSDPMGKNQNWVLIKQNNKVIGVHSKSTLKPIRKLGFPEEYESFSSAKTYQDWKFIYIGGKEKTGIAIN